MCVLPAPAPPVICQEVGFIAHPVDIHFFTGYTFDCHLGSLPAIGCFHKAVIVLIELGLPITVRMLLLILDPAERNVDFTAFRVNTVMVVLEIRQGNIFALLAL